MADNATQQDELVSQFCGMTGVRPSEARQYLDANNWDLQGAVTEFFTEQDEALVGGAEAESSAEPAETYSGGGRRLGDDSGAVSSSAQPAAPAAAPKRKPPPKKFATLRDLGNENEGEGDSDSDDHDEKQDLFAGGEKSGLAVQNPDDIKQKILEKARRAQPRSTEESKPKKSFFTGSARTLGGDEAPSRVIQDASPGVPQRAPRVSRTLHFWSDGFSVDDGDLYRSDDPRNAEILDGIRQGRAPLSIMNVQPGQEVDVEIKQHTENFVKPKPKYKPFAGAGQRLGSPTPAVDTTPQSSTPSASTATAPASTAPTEATIDESQPTVMLQVRLGDGTRLTSRFNITHTIGDVYEFVAAASPASQGRAWVLMTTFPSKELSDKAAVLGDLPEFKRGGVVVQKWQ